MSRRENRKRTKYYVFPVPATRVDVDGGVISFHFCRTWRNRELLRSARGSWEGVGEREFRRDRFDTGRLGEIRL